MSDVAKGQQSDYIFCLLAMYDISDYLIDWMNHSSKRPTTYNSVFYVCFFLIRHLLVDIYLINVTWFFRSILYSMFSEICMYLCIFEVKLRRRYTIHGRCSYFESTLEKKFLNFSVIIVVIKAIFCSGRIQTHWSYSFWKITLENSNSSIFKACK